VSVRRIAVKTAALVSALFAATSIAHAQAKEGCIRAETPAPGRLLAQSAPGMIELGRGLRSVRLQLACAADGRALSLAQRIAAAPPHRRFLLVIEDLRAEAQPGVLFDLKLGGATERAAQGNGALLGTLNFYAAQRPGVAARPRMVSYDVTETLRALAAGGRLYGGLVVAIQPVDTPAPGAGAAIGRIALVEQ
jgi:hypothetical protein